MADFLHDPVNAWLAAGAFIIAFEAFTAPGLGLFLVGLGAICTALVIKAGIVSPEAAAAQFAWCFAITVAWTALLWKPMARFRRQRKHADMGEVKNNNLMGETVIVAKGGLSAGDTGQVAWSGTLMSAQLDDPEIAFLPEGAKAQVHSVSGNILKVRPK